MNQLLKMDLLTVLFERVTGPGFGRYSQPSHRIRWVLLRLVAKWPGWFGVDGVVFQ